MFNAARDPVQKRPKKTSPGSGGEEPGLFGSCAVFYGEFGPWAGRRQLKFR